MCLCTSADYSLTFQFVLISNIYFPPISVKNGFPEQFSTRSQILSRKEKKKKLSKERKGIKWDCQESYCLIKVILKFQKMFFVFIFCNCILLLLAGFVSWQFSHAYLQNWSFHLTWKRFLSLLAITRLQKIIDFPLPKHLMDICEFFSLLLQKHILP